MEGTPDRSPVSKGDVVSDADVAGELTPSSAEKNCLDDEWLSRGGGVFGSPLPPRLAVRFRSTSLDS